MRPSVVLALVLAAVGALLISLLSTGPNPDADRQADAVGPNSVAPRAPAGPATILPSEPIQVPERTISQGPRQDAQRAVVDSGEQTFGSSLVGTVLDPDGIPLPDATVILERDGGLAGIGNLGLLVPNLSAQPKPQGLRSVTTDTNGEFQILEVEPGSRYQLTAKHEDFATTKLSMVAVRANEQTVEEITMTGGFTVLGYVHDNAGGAVQGAELRLVDLIHAQLPPNDPRVDAIMTETNSEGFYQFEHVAPGLRSLAVRKTGFGSQTASNLNVGGQSPTIPRDFILKPGLSIAGVVLSQDQQPIPGVRVRAISSDAGMTSSGFAETDQSGRFSMGDITAGTYSLIAEAEGWGNARQNRIEGGDTGVVIEMIEQGRVTGRVLFEADNKGVPDFDVFVRAVIPNSTVFGRRAGTAKVRGSRNGAFEVAGLSQGEYVVEATAPGLAPSYSESFEVAQSLTTTDVIVRLSSGGSLTGRLVSGSTGEPVVGARVTSHDNVYVKNPIADMLGAGMHRTTTARQVMTDKDGVFTLPNLWPDVYQINVSHPDHMQLIRTNIRVSDIGEPTDIGTISLDVGGTVTGTVYDSTGVGVASATVNLSGNSEAPTAFYEARTGSDGRYQIRNVVPGQYNLHATRPFDNTNPFLPIIDMNHSKVSVNISNRLTISQDLRLGE